MDRFALDARATLRALRRSPGTAVSALFALAMGIGFTTTMFSIVHGGTRSLPFDQPDELAIITQTLPRLGIEDFGAWAFDYRAWSEQQRSFDGLAAFTTTATNLSGDAESPERFDGALMTPNAFDLLGVRASRGRVFNADDARPGAPAVVVIGHELWTRRYDADTDIIGRVVRTDGEERTVIGVMPPGFAFPINADLWMPLDLPASAAPDEGSNVRVFGRLHDEVSMERAAADFAGIATRSGEAYPGTHAGRGIRVYPFAQMEMPPKTVGALYLMVFAVSFALLIACANVANLLLARAAARTREVAIRCALGASRSRVVGMHLIESVALAAAGGLIGLLIAHVAVRFFKLTTSNIIEAFWMEFRVDGTVVAFATALVMIAAMVAGGVPGLRAARTEPVETLRDQSGGSSGMRIGRLSRALVIVQVAFACGLLIMTGLFVRSALGLRATPMPFATGDILTAQFGITPSRQSDPAARSSDIRELMARFAAMPGVTAAAIVSALPGRGSGRWSFALDGQREETPGRLLTSVVFVTPGFLDVLGARLDRGRDFSWQDDLDARGVAIVNRNWIARYSPDVEPVGRRVTVGNQDFEIVGVVPDLQVQDIAEADGAGIYMPILQYRNWINVRLMAKTRGDPLALAPPAREAVAAVDPDLPFYELATLHDAIFADKKVLDTFGTLFFLFGLGALFMTIVGLYGVVAFGVNRRTREIGIRVALGAHRGDVLALVVRQGSRQVSIGLAIGLGIALGLSKALASAIEPLQPATLDTFVAVAGLLAGTAMLALILPARRAMQVQPVVALRQE